MQKLDIVEQLFPLVVTGEKKSTIRFREQRMNVGPMVYWCDGKSDKTVTVWVHRCTDMPLLEVASFLGMAEEWPKEAMLEDMRIHYPNIKLLDIVQVVEHFNPTESHQYLSQA